MGRARLAGFVGHQQAAFPPTLEMYAMAYTAARTINVKTTGGTTEVRNRGDAVPEADTMDLRVLGRLIRGGWLVTDGTLPDGYADTARANARWSEGL